jgi:hypothetical protein
MPVVLTEQFGEIAMVVEVEFERILGFYLRNCCFDPLTALIDGFFDFPSSSIDYSIALTASS